MPAHPPVDRPTCIRLRGVRQNNLKGFDLDIPLGRFTVVTGLSGAGKSSLVFETLHAEGQRRYVETFSAYTRQFLDLLNKPKVDSIENIRPSIAIEQTNTVKTSRSTVGTMTEIADYAKVWFSHVARCFDPATGEAVEDESPAVAWQKARAQLPEAQVLLGFPLRKPDNFSWPEILGQLRAQAYARVLLPRPAPEATLDAAKVEDLLAATDARLESLAEIIVVQDRLRLAEDQHARFIEAVEAAYRWGRGEVVLLAEEPSANWKRVAHYSRGLHSPTSGRTFRPATPPLFSFNSPLGACPKCRGFGRTIDIDLRLAIPDASKSLNEGALACWEGEVYSECKRDLFKVAKKAGLPLNVPFAELTESQRSFVIDGEPGYGENGREWPNAWYGVKGFFSWLEKNTYKMHVRVFLSRYRTYRSCPECRGARLQPEALCWQWRGRTLPALYQLPVADLLTELEAGGPPTQDRSANLAYDSILTRLRYLREVGLGYLTLDRTSRTLSGGEVERVNLCSCLGTQLVDTLFVLDEPSVGLHPRDIDRLIRVIRQLTDAGNTVVVVEHDEAMMRAADHLIEVGPEPGARGGYIVYSGTFAGIVADERSLSGAYLSGRRSIPAPATRRPVCLAVGAEHQTPALTLRGISHHNLRDVDVQIPLQRLVCLSGVSGSGKSTLLEHALHQGLLTHRNHLQEDPATIRSISCALDLGEIVLVDQSPLARTPRSNAALYCEAWDAIRDLYARTPEARAKGFDSASFSFNAGDGRCDHCQGLGYEKVEMQFLSDVYTPCPICEGRRFKPEMLEIKWSGLSVADLLETQVETAAQLFADFPKVANRLKPLVDVGLGYLTLGQPINTLSGGESQRLKLVHYLAGLDPASKLPALLLLDEPTTGLHRHDVARLLQVLQALVERGHSVVVIEHNLDVLKSADWIIEVGPEAGDQGGRIVFAGTPEAAAKAPTATAPYLASALAGTASPLTVKATDLPEPRFEPPAFLEVHGARENNLKNLSVRLPHHALSVVTGVSGSGKSTLAFDIVFAEGQRRFMESMSPYARQFVEQMPRPAVDAVTGIPPTVAIEQRVTRGSRKSTVATITEVAQYLRLLYARLGIQHHPETGRPVQPLSPGALRKLLASVLAGPKARKAKHLYLCAPLVRGRKGHHQPIATWLDKQGFELMRTDGRIQRVDTFQRLDRYREHDIEAVVADLKAPARSTSQLPDLSTSQPPNLSASQPPNLSTSLETALTLGKGSCFLCLPDGEILSWFSTTRTDAESGESFPELDPKHFSFNSARGWCPTCRGHGRVFPWMAELEKDNGDEDDPALRLRELGVEFSEDETDEGRPCPDCSGQRLNRIARAVRLHRRGKRPALSLPELLRLTPSDLLEALRQLELDARGRAITEDLIPQIEERLKFLSEVGLGYLSLDRPTETLSGGEAQRIRLAAQLGSNLAGVLYVLDEPSIGLHARDNDRLIETLKQLRDRGNTVLVVEHDDELMAQADHLLDLGPGAGRHGGEILAQGTPAEVKKSDASLTGLFLARGIAHPLRGKYRAVGVAGGSGKGRGRADRAKPAGPSRRGALDTPKCIRVEGARHRNLKGIDIEIPLGRLVMVAGPSGAGKSTLFREVVRPAIEAALKAGKRKLSGREFKKLSSASVDTPPFGTLDLADADFKSTIEVDQAPIGKTPRSTPATYLGIFDLIRQFFATLPESRLRGWTASRFSFNTADGRCETCQGAGRVKLEMAFMPATFLPCDGCGGKRYSPETAAVKWKDKGIGEVLELTFEEAAAFFSFHSQLQAVCQLMVDCGLGYLTLGQSSPTLSGGEAQRLKLVTELSRGLASYKERSRGQLPKNLYLLEEPTIGLHLSDCEKLIKVLHALVDQGHTVVVIEHHLDLLAEADWLIELGPTGGPDGGHLLYQGPAVGVLKAKASVTREYLRGKVPPA
ncbi:excinuclease ABC subunit UvrA [Nibricoccus sp. IMCC34717]|uniref:excinuclease ABC subunit UvrA n=1 Tax=Nibricoccus sp. IMCC34717 TaxID=3034021 RepID=UPI00384A9D6D